MNDDSGAGALSAKETNNHITVSDRHHAWVKAEAKRRGINARALMDELVIAELRRTEAGE